MIDTRPAGWCKEHFWMLLPEDFGAVPNPASERKGDAEAKEKNLKVFIKA